MIRMSRQKAITAFFCEKYGDHIQHNQCTSSESVNLAASAEPVDLDEDYSIQTAGPEPTPAEGHERGLPIPFPSKLFFSNPSSNPTIPACFAHI